MSKSTNHVAVDMGRSGVKMAMFTYSEGKLQRRWNTTYPLDTVQIHGRHYIDIYSIFKNIDKGLKIILKQFGSIDSCGIDGWGSDYGLLLKNGELLGNVYFHRDRRTLGIKEKIESIITWQDYFKLTGCDFNSEYIFPQLYSQVLDDKDTLSRAEEFLFIPDLLTYFFTGEKSVDITMAGAACLLDRKTEKWNEDLFNRFNIPMRLAPRLVRPGAEKGIYRISNAEEGKNSEIKFISVAGHDSANALAVAYGIGKNDLFVSAGSTVTAGRINDAPVLSEEARLAGFKNLPEALGRNMFYHDLNGFWILNDCLKYWNSIGKNTDIAKLEKGLLTDHCESVVDLSDPSVSGYEIPVPEAIKAYLEKRGEKVPVTDVQVFDVILRSIAFSVAKTMKQLDELDGNTTNRIIAFSGGSRSDFFLKRLSEYTGKPIIRGLADATGTGNALIQAASVNGITELPEIGQIMKNTYEYECF